MVSPPGAKKVLIGIFGLPIIVLMIVFSYLGVVNKPEGPPIQKQEEVKQHNSPLRWFKGAKLDLGDFSVTEYVKTNNGVEKKFTIQGKKLGMENKKLGFISVPLPKIVCIKDIEVAFYENNLPVSYIWAESAVSGIPFDFDNMSVALPKQLDFSGDITLVTEDKRILTCDKLRWDKENGRLLARGNCHLKYESERIKADLIKTDVTLKDFTVSKDKNKRIKKIAEVFFH